MSLLYSHRSHDYRALVARWRKVAAAAGLKMRPLIELSGEVIYWLESPLARQGTPACYLSSGVHGDEPAAASGLLAWAEQNLQRLRTESFLIFPCLNPHGLILNTRVDHRGLDINRRFHLKDDPLCAAWHEVLAGRPMNLGLCLHEDYDGQGCYVYELSPYKEALSSRILPACTHLIPPDQRSRIDISRAKGGIIRRKRAPVNLPGMPEALVLLELGCPTTLTFETPSEFGLDARVETQIAFIDAALEALGAEEAFR